MKLELKEVSCGYGGHKVLDHVDLEVDTGEVCCLLGPNGVGKTTLFKTILKLMPPVAGEVRIDGQDIARWGAPKLARYMAYVSQFHVPPFPYIVKDVVLLGRIGSVGYFGQPKEQDYDIRDKALADMGIEHLRDNVYTDISGGERQLVMIARALAQEPRMLVLDEPTASLDYGNMVRVMSKVKALAGKGYGVIMTTHSPDQAFMAASKVALLMRGAPVRFGRPEDVITKKNLKDAYGVDVSVVEFADESGRPVRVCAPSF
ncbi:MAG: ABC transporter ATP-binding protein [Clostridiales Family XIII bacterium]|jgi:ABC-type cobalamin/Fe3+-siderophores transport system ATPase subunit|nr:ABC transporter ATP-binding protein [Clostridiales Family XIII bacterium]